MTPLYLFPFAGAGSGCYDRLVGPDPADAVYLSWASADHEGPDGVRDLAAQLARTVADDLRSRAGPAYAMFGHSMGALVAFETASLLQEEGVAPPAVLGVSGRIPPDRGSRPAADPDDLDSVREYLHTCGGDLAQLAEEPEFVEFAAERLRGDLVLGRDYVFRPRPPLRCELRIFGGREDPFAGPEEILGWTDRGAAGGSVHVYPGGHWFLWDHADPIMEALSRT